MRRSLEKLRGSARGQLDTEATGRSTLEAAMQLNFRDALARVQGCREACCKTHAARGMQQDACCKRNVAGGMLHEAFRQRHAERGMLQGLADRGKRRGRLRYGVVRRVEGRSFYPEVPGSKVRNARRPHQAS